MTDQAEPGSRQARAKPVDAARQWTHRACRRTIIDLGRQAGHPADCQDGHAEGCPRLAAAVAAWSASCREEGEQ
jgi:hypothetical protein